MDNRKKEEKRKQEDAALNRALMWFVAAVVLEFLLLFVNRFYINLRSDTASVNLAWGIHYGMWAAFFLGLAGAAVCAFLCWKGWLSQGKLSFPLILLGWFLLALSVCSILIVLFRSPAVHLLYLLVPAGAVIALVYYLYQREFFFSACGVAAGMLGLFVVRKNGGGYDGIVTAYVILASVVLLAALALLYKLKQSGGALTVKGKELRILSKQANLLPVALSFAVSLAAMVAGLVLGQTLAYYLLFVMMAWLFVLLVYYTVKLM